ncbi:MAG: hypothetical protein IT370_03060 [Deltaproteobacteria bacterium]|nr:hypothetical protein [Deltaproteobacteria bacterium]
MAMEASGSKRKWSKKSGRRIPLAALLAIVIGGVSGYMVVRVRSSAEPAVAPAPTHMPASASASHRSGSASAAERDSAILVR